MRSDLTGQTFGRLTVVGFSYRNDKGIPYWDCICSCGSSKKVSSIYLTNKKGFNISCGCAKRDYNKFRPDTYNNLTGQKFGKLTVVGFNSKRKYTRKTGDIYYRYYWDCKCDCGNNTIALGPSLKNGHTKSCGCHKISKAKSNLNNLVGIRSGKIIVENFSHIRNECSFWLCKCDCGNHVVIRSDGIINKTSQSCGCSRFIRKYNYKAGRRKSMGALFQVWSGMINRCYNVANRGYKDYGGRGIEVCERWRVLFNNFYEDMGLPIEGYSIDRVDVNGNYEPGNCRWATDVEQSRNKRNNVNINIFGTIMCVSAWGEIVKIKPGTISSRIARNWSDIEAIFTPVGSKRGIGYIVEENKIIDLNGVTLWNY
jgi:hypothetical protein